MTNNYRSRRTFLKNSTSLMAGAMFLPPKTWRTATETLFIAPAATANIAEPTHAPMVAIQVGPESFVDEGVDALLDWLKEKAGVNTICLTTFTYGQGFAGRLGPGRLFPGHGELSAGGYASMAATSLLRMHNFIPTRFSATPRPRTIMDGMSSPKSWPQHEKRT